MKKILILLLIIILFSCEGNKFNVDGYFRIDSKGYTSHGAIYNGSINIKNDNIYVIDGKKNRIDKFYILEKNINIGNTEYYFVDEHERTGTMKVCRFKNEIIVEYNGDKVTFFTR